MCPLVQPSEMERNAEMATQNVDESIKQTASILIELMKNGNTREIVEWVDKNKNVAGLMPGLVIFLTARAAGVTLPEMEICRPQERSAS